MGETCTDPSCPIAAPHHHGTITCGANGLSAPAVIYHAPDNGGKVVRDSETGEIIFEARKDRVRLAAQRGGE